MPWQDLVLSGGTAIAVIALIPSILSKNKPAFSTSILNGIVMGIFTFVYINLSLWFTASLVALLSILWLILASQKHRKT